MSLASYKITDAAVDRSGVIAAPDKLTGTAAQNKMVFDRLIRETVKELYNGLIETLAGAGGASEIGTAEIGGLVGGDVQTALGSLKTLLDTKSADADVTAALTVLGYAPNEISTALRGVDLEALSVEEAIKVVLRGSLK